MLEYGIQLETKARSPLTASETISDPRWVWEYRSILLWRLNMRNISLPLERICRIGPIDSIRLPREQGSATIDTTLWIRHRWQARGALGLNVELPGFR